MSAIYIAEVLETGEVVSSSSYVEGIPEVSIRGGMLVKTPERVIPGTCFYSEGQFLSITERPSVNHVFNYVTKEWELDKERLRNGALVQRNALLLASDWTQLPDVPNEVRLSWKEYRQLLRDITEQVDYPIDIQWPTPPGK